MTQIGSPQYGLAGYSCVSKPLCTQDDPDAPLMYALGFAIDSHKDLGHFLSAIFPPYPKGVPGGGDPGWLWYHELDGDGHDVVVVTLDDLVAPPEGAWATYLPSKVRYEVRVALSNFAVMWPSRLAEVDAVIREYDLAEVDIPPGLATVPVWDGRLPVQLVTNG